jgi:hypothetical protein
MVLQEIFKTNPGLLEHPEVKHLISYVSEQHRINIEKLIEVRERECNALEAVFNSEIFVIGGTPAKEALQRVIQILE